jgi:serine protease
MRRTLLVAAPFLVVLFATRAAAAQEAPTAVDEPAPGEVDGVIEGEIVVDVRDDATDAAIAALARDHGLTLTPNSPWSAAHDKLEDAHVAPADEARIVAELASDPRVERVEPTHVLRASFVPNDPLFASKQWHLQRVGAERAWDYASGRGVTVAVVDTGIACFDQGPFTRGTDLAGTRCDRGYDFVNDRAGA